MKFLTDENIASSVLKSLRNENFDVKDIKEEGLYGISDRKIIDIAFKEERIIITHDKSFGNIINDHNIKHKGVIFIRCKNQSPNNVSNILVEALKSEIKDKLKDSLVIISEEQINIIKRDLS